MSIAIVGTAFLACGLTVTGSPAEPQSSESPSSPSSGSDPPESRGTTFACGASSTCSTGLDLCCEETPGTFACRSIDAGGCPSAPDGGQPTSALACTTYNACPSSDECCYNPTTRSSVCKSQCSNGEDELCRLGSDNCGQNRDCEPTNNPPAPGVGQCRYSGGNSNSNSSNGYPGGGFPGGGSSSRGW